MSVRDIAREFAGANVVRIQSLLYAALVFNYDPTEIKASEYVFTEPLTTLQIAKRLTEGDYNSELVRLTFIEGERATTYGERAATVLENFDAETFRELAEPLEGKLYPETYLVPPDFTEAQLVDHLVAGYETAIAPRRASIEASPFSEYEVLILASIIEREANTPDSMRMVSGILQNRLALGMPLQADATIEYALDMPIAKLPEGQLAAELRETDSPYNTYLNKGLPPTPIGNPGIEAITAVLEPTPSRYLFYITGNNGEFYYAETLVEHNENIARYLR